MLGREILYLVGWIKPLSDGVEWFVGKGASYEAVLGTLMSGRVTDVEHIEIPKRNFGVEALPWCTNRLVLPVGAAQHSKNHLDYAKT